MTPATITSGFRRCGVFNPDAIDCSVGVSNPEASLVIFDDGSVENSEGENDKDDSRQNQLFQAGFEEGYDLPDPDYLEWLRFHHPESLPKNPLHDGGRNSSADDLLSAEPAFFEGCDEGDGLVDSLTFEALMGYGGNIFSPLDMLDNNDTSETGESTILPLSRATPGSTHPPLTDSTPGGSTGSTNPHLSLVALLVARADQPIGGEGKKGC